MISKGFFDQIEMIAHERMLAFSDVLEKVAIGLKKACALEGFSGDIQVEFNEEKKRIKIVEVKTVVEEVDPDGPDGQITLEEAHLISEKHKIGSVLRHEINIEKEIGRKGASQFKQIFNQGLKELSRKRSYEFFKERENEMITARVVKVTEEAVVLSVGMEYEATMPLKDAIPKEVPTVGADLRVLITKVEETGKGPKVYVSRAHRDLVKRLLEQIVPEISSGVIDVINIARDPGSKAKVMVKSNNPQVEAKGAVVGMAGIRIKQISQALCGEKVEVFAQRERVEDTVADSMSPARVLSVIITEAEKKALVIVPDDQFSLAIGRGGQNARLASQASGWKCDIKDESTCYKQGIRFKPNITL